MRRSSIALAFIVVVASMFGFGRPAAAFESYIYGTAYDANTGDRLWFFKVGSSIQSSPAVDGNVVYVGASDHSLFRYRIMDASYWTKFCMSRMGCNTENTMNTTTSAIITMIILRAARTSRGRSPAPPR